MPQRTSLHGRSLGLQRARAILRMARPTKGQSMHICDLSWTAGLLIQARSGYQITAHVFKRSPIVFSSKIVAIVSMADQL